jgi:probable rRNA maturation factor
MSAALREDKIVPISIQREHPGRFSARLLRRAVKTTLQMEGINDRSVEISIAMVDDEAIRQLNAQYRKKDQPTDVLSFPMEQDVRIPGMPRLLGDVVISMNTAARQAKAGGRSLDEELCHLVIHGVLHLLGYDDATAEGYTEMVEKGAAIWGRISDTPSPAPPGC